MNHVYLSRPGANEELRYSLRSLAKFVPYDQVWIIGAWPSWVRNVSTIEHTPPGTKHQITTAHLKKLCELPEVPDPFTLWHDDMYATQPLTEVPTFHNGPVRPRTSSISRTWHSGQRATYQWLIKHGYPQPLGYDLHVPLIIYKAAMLEALARVGEIAHSTPHKRTLYGNIAGLGGTYLARDCKVVSRAAKIEGPWLSSADATFKNVVLPRLAMLNEPGRFEG